MKSFRRPFLIGSGFGKGRFQNGHSRIGKTVFFRSVGEAWFADFMPRSRKLPLSILLLSVGKQDKPARYVEKGSSETFQTTPWH
ncbi:hypothetical protein HMPREF2572_08750 [Neisseria sp. HMSC064E01]|nr:hypothetical protein HMPREF2572_08750 [Neisseria sp. HMSC064E01]